VPRHLPEHGIGEHQLIVLKPYESRRAAGAAFGKSALYRCAHDWEVRKGDQQHEGREQEQPGVDSMKPVHAYGPRGGERKAAVAAVIVLTTDTCATVAWRRLAPRPARPGVSCC